MPDAMAKFTDDQLRAKLKTAVAMQRTVLIIFGAIVLAWIVLGYWRTNTPVFIVTVVMSVAVGGSMIASTLAVRRELARRAAEG